MMMMMMITMTTFTDKDGQTEDSELNGNKHSPNLIHYVTFRNKLYPFFTLRSYQPPIRHPNQRTSPCRLSTIAYSIYSELPSMSGGLLLHPPPEETPCLGDRGAT